MIIVKLGRLCMKNSTKDIYKQLYKDVIDHIRVLSATEYRKNSEAQFVLARVGRFLKQRKHCYENTIEKSKPSSNSLFLECPKLFNEEF